MAQTWQVWSKVDGDHQLLIALNILLCVQCNARLCMSDHCMVLSASADILVFYITDVIEDNTLRPMVFETF